MPRFTDVQLQQVAQALNELSAQVGQLRLDAIRGGRPLNDPEVTQLLGWSLALANLGATFAARAAEVTLADTLAAVQNILSSTDAAQAALSKLARLDTVISIASAAVVLASAVFTGNPKQIALAAKDLLEAAVPAHPTPSTSSPTGGPRTPA
ncbi:MAG TPA: hypothetical protein VM865_09355 [Acidobacteriaceae bacterium]|jgi:hypothetical protein|nr:hypothetical protein [Acidobacteriaceae bacterium]